MSLPELKAALAALGRPEAKWGSIQLVQASLAASRAWAAEHPGKAAEHVRLCGLLDDEEKRLEELAALERRDRKFALALAKCGLGPRALDGVDVSTETQALEAAREWLNGGKRSTWLILLGSKGTGKTVAATWALKSAAEAGESVAFRSAPQLARQSSFDDGAREIEWLKRVGFLVIDDLGAENLTAHAQGILFEILDHRHQHYLRTVITSNVAASELEARAGSRLVDRWREDGRVVQLAGVSMRSVPVSA